ncbi:MAG: cobalamin-binding protein [Desulfitobacteriaceae bacterium]|nr:cobalamin-binding protein [Desulfitobacteriaceae bacterium]
MKKNLLIVMGVLLALFIAGCGGQADNSKEEHGQQFTDSSGREVMIEKAPENIISLSPATTEILFSLGLGEKIVGNTDYCDYPEEAKQVDKIGGFENPNLELIIEKEPDIVFTAAGLQEEITDKLEEVGIAVVCLDAETIEQVMDNIILTGTITGTDKKAGEIVRDMQERLDSVKAKVEGQPVPNVFFEVWDDPLMTAGKGSFIDSLITLAGGKNIASDLNEEFANYSLEQLLLADPEYYLLNNHAHSPAEVKERNGYQEMSAIKNNRVYSIEDDLVTLPGPRIIEGLEEIAKLIHPEAFAK